MNQATIERDMKPLLSKIRRAALWAGGAGWLISILGFGLNRLSFYEAYLTSFLFWIGIALGSLAVIFLHHLTDGGWGYPVRRILERIVYRFPVFILFFLPIAFGLKDIYIWANPEMVAHDEVLLQKTAYLNHAFFAFRAVLYFAIWSVMGFLAYRWSKQSDKGRCKLKINQLQVASGIGLVLYGLTVTFAATDWAMSLEPDWYSTIYGFVFMAGQVLSALCFSTFAALFLSGYKPFTQIMTVDRSHDLGNLIFAFILFWTYVIVCQFVIIWSGNLTEEVPWYLKRFEGGWAVLAILIVLFHFFTPFFLLLMRYIKRHFKLLMKVVALILVMRYADLVWMVEPAFQTHSYFHCLDIAACLAIGGPWLALLLKDLEGETFVLGHDPQLQESEEKHESESD